MVDSFSLPELAFCINHESLNTSKFIITVSKSIDSLIYISLSKQNLVSLGIHGILHLFTKSSSTSYRSVFVIGILFHSVYGYILSLDSNLIICNKLILSSDLFLISRNCVLQT